MVLSDNLLSCQVGGSDQYSRFVFVPGWYVYDLARVGWLPCFGRDEKGMLAHPLEAYHFSPVVPRRESGRNPSFNERAKMPGRCRPQCNALKIAEAAHWLSWSEIPAGDSYK